MCVCVCVCVCVCIRTCARACVRACVCVCACVCVLYHIVTVTFPLKNVFPSVLQLSFKSLKYLGEVKGGRRAVWQCDCMMMERAGDGW